MTITENEVLRFHLKFAFKMNLKILIFLTDSQYSVTKKYNLCPDWLDCQKGILSKNREW